MPFIVPFIPAIAAAASATVGGLEASGAIGGSHGPSAQQIETMNNQANQKAQQEREQQLFKHFAPDAQAQTGGALSDTSLSSMIAELSGAPADAGLAQKTVFGSTPGLSTSDFGGGN